MAPMNRFVTEHNVDIFVAKLQTTADPQERDNLLRLLSAEQSRMTLAIDHLEDAQRRVDEGRERICRQREERDRLEQAGLSTDGAASLLETLQRTQVLLEAHCQRLRADFGPRSSEGLGLGRDDA